MRAGAQLRHLAARLLRRLRPRLTVGARALLLDADGRVALVRHRYIDGWYLPGGGVDRGEDAATAAIREVREEVGIADARVVRALGVYLNRREGRDDHVAVFVLRTGAPDALHAADGLEIADAGWFDPADPPPGTTPATRRRLAEHRAGTTGTGDW